MTDLIKLPVAAQVFDFGGRKVRTAGTHAAPLFCAADVCAVLGISDVSDACSRLDGDELEAVQIKTERGSSRSNYVTESGLFSLILGSRKPEAKAFKRWVTGTVLPEIRKRGFFDAVAVAEATQTERLLEQIFPKLPGKAAPIFRELIASLLRLRRQPEAAGNPPWARSLARSVYEWAIPVAGQQAFRRGKNTTPNGSHVDYSMLNELAIERVRSVAQTGVHFTKISRTWEQWKVNMELAFGTKAIQLPMLVPMLAPPKGER